MDEVTFTIDDREVAVGKERTILQAALQNAIYIPHLCYHPDLEPLGVCRLCMVEADAKMVLACRTAAERGMTVRTRSPRLDELRRVNVEVLVANHHLTCRGCKTSSRCTLQKIMAYIRIDRKRVQRLRPPKEDLPLDNSNPFFDYAPNKCVLCQICIHTCKQIQHALNLIGRGYNTKVAFFGDASICKSCRQCVIRCPVGALTPKENVSFQKQSLPESKG